MLKKEDLIEAAQRYLQKGWRVVPIPPGKKRPVLKGWPKLDIKEAELGDYFGDGDGIGLLLGDASGGLGDVDLDCPEAISLADSFLPETHRIHGHK